MKITRDGCKKQKWNDLAKIGIEHREEWNWTEILRNNLMKTEEVMRITGDGWKKKKMKNQEKFWTQRI